MSTFFALLKRGKLSTKDGEYLPGLPSEICTLIRSHYEHAIQTSWETKCVTDVMWNDMIYVLALVRSKLDHSAFLAQELWCKSHSLTKLLFKLTMRNEYGLPWTVEKLAYKCCNNIVESVDRFRIPVPERLVLLQPLTKCGHPRACDYVQNFGFEEEAIRYIKNTLSGFKQLVKLLGVARFVANDRKLLIDLQKALGKCDRDIGNITRLLSTSQPKSVLWDPRGARWRKRKFDPA